MEIEAAKLKHDIQELLFDLNNYGLCDPPTNCIRAGVLSYHRESDNPRLDIKSADLEPPFECPSTCEYCRRKAMPVLDWRWEDELEAVPEFCCAERKLLCVALLRKRPLVDEEDEGHGKPSDLAAALLSDREKRNAKNITDLSRGLMELAGLKRDDDASQKAETTPEAKILSFRLGGSAEEGGWTLMNISENVVQLKNEEDIFICDHKPPLFGICHHKERKHTLTLDRSRTQTTHCNCFCINRKGSFNKSFTRTASPFLTCSQMALLSSFTRETAWLYSLSSLETKKGFASCMTTTKTQHITEPFEASSSPMAWRLVITAMETYG
ncbi:uncharacterized protein LOC130929936 isoform X2 [Corythoichthys intestinalis]|nr:uncharacterized protein LOC130929936 isoform X2 [Corythoichthys intestinalis]